MAESDSRCTRKLFKVYLNWWRQIVRTRTTVTLSLHEVVLLGLEKVSSEWITLFHSTLSSSRLFPLFQVSWSVETTSRTRDHLPGSNHYWSWVEFLAATFSRAHINFHCHYLHKTLRAYYLHSFQRDSSHLEERVKSALHNNSNKMWLFMDAQIVLCLSEGVRYKLRWFQ